MNYSDLVIQLSDALARPLPGPSAQAMMAPRPRGNWPESPEPAYRSAAGLLLVYPRETHPHVLLTVRSSQVRHAGQVSMPGGVIEPGEGIVEAALREAHEEVAFADADVRVLGHLSPVDIAVSGFRLHPVLATIDRTPALQPADREVERILDIPVSALLNPAHLDERPMTRGGIALVAPAFVLHGVVIWGATAMVLAEFLALTGWQGPQRS
ncbi:MAG: CoA pyrophosphatase [Vicinamibacterales bacterium]